GRSGTGLPLRRRGGGRGGVCPVPSTGGSDGFQTADPEKAGRTVRGHYIVGRGLGCRTGGRGDGGPDQHPAGRAAGDETGGGKSGACAPASVGGRRNGAG